MYQPHPLLEGTTPADRFRAEPGEVLEAARVSFDTDTSW